jgi:ribosome-binding protein aMBF1 (putative translation factor)
MESGAWKRVAERVRVRRDDELGLSQEQLAAKAGVGTATIRKIETAAQDRYNRSTLRSLSQALGWAPQGIHELLEGNEPSPAEAKGPSAAAEMARLREELAALRDEVAEMKSRQSS